MTDQQKQTWIELLGDRRSIKSLLAEEELCRTPVKKEKSVLSKQLMLALHSLIPVQSGSHRASSAVSKENIFICGFLPLPSSITWKKTLASVKRCYGECIAGQGSQMLPGSKMVVDSVNPLTVNNHEGNGTRTKRMTDKELHDMLVAHCRCARQEHGRGNPMYL